MICLGFMHSAVEDLKIFRSALIRMAQVKAKKELVIEVQPILVKDIRVPSQTSPVVSGDKFQSLNNPDGERHYVTTAIHYTNGWPHIGHAYENAITDVQARYHRLAGRDVMFMTGTDEHGMKIAQSAVAAGMEPIDLCTKYTNGFKALNERLAISNDSYIRTTDDFHKKTAQKLWEKCAADIYLSQYEGYYLVREERYVTEREAKEWGYKDPVSGADLKKSKEESYFFRMSKYQQAVIDHIKANPDFIVPEQYRTEILGRLEAEPLEDLCVSRTSFAWGIPVPNHPEHVMYVWYDALTNYISGVHLLDEGNEDIKKFWPAYAHVIGKDIVWFHAVIWPCMLMSANIPLPGRIAVHGFILDADGKKMSKSLGNVVDPHDLLDKYPADSVRWYMCSSVYGLDFKFSLEQLEDYHRADLGNNLGNLVSRAVALSGGSVPDVPSYESFEKPFDLTATLAALDTMFLSHQIGDAANLIRQRTTDTNKWLADSAPWAIKEDAVKKATLIRIALEAVYVLAHMWAPFIPFAAGVIFDKVGQDPVHVTKLKAGFNNLENGAPVSTNKSILFDPLRK